MLPSQWSLTTTLFENISPSAIIEFYLQNLTWSLFLTSTAIHAVLLITSPLQAVYKWYRRQSSDSDTAIPYLCGAIGSVLWLRYAIFIQDIKLVLLQTYAVIMQTFFVFAMLFYRSKKRRLFRIIICIFTGIFILFFIIAHLPHNIGLQVTGICASGAQIIGSFVCPYLIYKAISSKVIDFVPFAPVAFTLVMEMHAIIYSVGVKDFYLLSANSIFFCMDGCLLAMFFIFPTERKTSNNNNNNRETEGLLNKVNVL